MKKFLSLLSLSIWTAPLLLAADGATTAQPPQKNAPTEKSVPAEPKIKTDESAPITVKNKSSFNIDPAARSPFWPISWKPAGKVAAGGTDQGEVPPGAFLVTSITLDGATHFAIINGKTMSEGQKFGLQIGTHIYQVEIKQIEDGRVILNHGGDDIVVPLRRK
jgi:hypothetical protein